MLAEDVVDYFKGTVVFLTVGLVTLLEDVLLLSSLFLLYLNLL